MLWKGYTRPPLASPTSEFDLSGAEDQTWKAGGTDELPDRAAGGKGNGSAPSRPLVTKDLSKDCQLLNLTLTLGGY